MIACESKINIFEEMSYFLMFYLNLGFIVRLALVLLILSRFFFQLDVVFSELLFSYHAFTGNFYHQPLASQGIIENH